MISLKLTIWVEVYSFKTKGLDQIKFGCHTHVTKQIFTYAMPYCVHLFTTWPMDVFTFILISWPSHLSFSLSHYFASDFFSQTFNSNQLDPLNYI